MSNNYDFIRVVLHQRLVSTITWSHQSGLGNTHRTHTEIHRWPSYGPQRSSGRCRIFSPRGLWVPLPIRLTLLLWLIYLTSLLAAYLLNRGNGVRVFHGSPSACRVGKTCYYSLHLLQRTFFFNLSLVAPPDSDVGSFG